MPQKAGASSRGLYVSIRRLRMPIEHMMTLTAWPRPLDLLRQLALLCAAGLGLLAAASVGAGALPVALAGSMTGSAVLYLTLVGLSVLCVKLWQRLAAQRAVTDMVGRVEQLVGENRLLDFSARMQSRVEAAEATAKLEREVNHRERRIQRMVYEGKIAELRQQSTLEGLERDLEYYKREHARLMEENRWMKAALRQNHIDLAYLKEHVDRFLAGHRPTLLTRVRGLFMLSSPSPGIVKIAQELEGQRTIQSS